MAFIVFDLDGTTINTAHRYRNKPCGEIDLQFWFDNSTPENIARDSLLPLADSWRALYAAGHTIIVCTARSFEPSAACPSLPNPRATYCEFLAKHSLHYDALLHRELAGPDHESLGDGELKMRLLSDYFGALGFASVAEARPIVFDDNLQVLAAMAALGVEAYHPDNTRAINAVC